MLANNNHDKVKNKTEKNKNWRNHFHVKDKDSIFLLNEIYYR